MRPYVGEAVLAADERVPDADLAVAAAGCDARVLRVRGLAPIERSIGDLHAACSGRWVLRLDSDELPSAALLAGLESMVAACDLTHWLIPRAWLHPGAGTRLAGPPWWPDLQVRLVRNDPSVLRWPREVHEPVGVAGPCRIAAAPILHADLLLNDVAARRRKVDFYSRLRPGLQVGGRELNAAYYLPEDLDEPPPVRPLDPQDAALVEQVLHGPAIAPRAAVPPVERLVAGGTHRPPRRRLRPVARLRAPEEVRLEAGARRRLLVVVENLTRAPWPWGSLAPGIHVAGDGDGERAVELPGPVGPGEAIRVPVTVRAPRSGAASVELRLGRPGEPPLAAAALTVVAGP